MCPKIKYSCCTEDDFIKTKSLWEEKSKQIKLYISQLFKAVHRLNTLQPSLVMVTNFFERKKIQCPKVNFSFFKTVLRSNDLYFYLENAFDSFAFLQKGFYCMLCDAESHQFIKNKEDFRKVNVISYGFCKQLIFFFKEYLTFKVYHLDSAIENIINLEECLIDS